MIEAVGLTKRYGQTLAVDGLSFEVRPGHVTGFLGPNGEGKSTTMRMILGLDAPTAGSVTVNGRPYRLIHRPLREVGALLDASAVHPGRSGRAHLLALAEANHIPRSRVDEVLALVGLTGVAKRRARGYSLGMGQRLGIAAALLGDPGTLLFDEPLNGLDPEGIQWVRNFFRALAGEGRTVFVSSHLMSEMALMADEVVVIGRGRLIAAQSVDAFIQASSQNFVRVRCPRAGELEEALVARGASVTREQDGALAVSGLEPAAIGQLAHDTGLVLHELSPQQASLEEAFMELTAGAVEFHGGGLPSNPHLDAVGRG